jgi:hypothetical protein
MSIIDAPTPLPPMAQQGTMPMAPPAPKWHDVTVKFKRKKQRARVEAVPPEEFGIGRSAKSIDDANYCFHETRKTEGDLIQQGYDEAQVKKLPSYNSTDGIERASRDTVEESTSTGDDGVNRANREITVTEHYVRMAYKDDDVCLYRVTTAGEGDVLKRDGKDDVEQIDFIPFAAMTPVPVTHRFFGRSIADLVMDIQKIKTALLRGLLDNIYMANLPRPVVSEQGATESTLDDLLVAQHGKPIRVKGSVGDAIMWQTVPDISGHVYPALQYQDATREWRTGVSRQGQGTDPNALQNQVATIANQMFNAAQAKTKLIARIFAETGIRDMFSLLHAIVRKHGSVKQTVRLRNKWVDVDPRQWRERSDMTINVGLGNGTQGEQIAHMTTIIALQKEALAAGKTNLVSDANLYNSAKEMTKLVKLKDVDAYFTDPKDQPPPQPQEDPEITKAKMKAEIEKLQAMADIEVNKQKVHADAALGDRKANADIAINQMKTEADLELARQKAVFDLEIKRAELEMKREEHAMKMREQSVSMSHKEAEHGMRIEEHGIKAEKPGKGKDGKPTMGPLSAAIANIGESHKALVQALNDQNKQAGKPKRIRGPSGKVYQIEQD